MPSTAIEWAHWRDGVLSVKYLGGDAYDYLEVPEDVYRAMEAAPSKGRFVNLELKPRYPCRRRRG
jgi:hypothetical protein